MQLHEHRAARDGGDVANAEDRPASLEPKPCVLSRIFSDNRGRDYSVSERCGQAPFSTNLGWEFRGKIYPAGILDEDTGTIVRVFRREV